jgi:hypothetical protein
LQNSAIIIKPINFPQKKSTRVLKNAKIYVDSGHVEKLKRSPEKNYWVENVIRKV